MSAPSQTLALTLRNIKKRFGNTDTIHGIDLDIAEGEFVVFVGPSGCGKSTLLRMIAGLETVTAGVITINDIDVTFASPSARKVAMVFQSYALYPHMTVLENLTFGMRMRGVAKDTIASKVKMAVDMLRLQPYLGRKPGALSGGQCQRVAIGRALVQEPDVFLFDEPLSNLDAELRLKTRIEIAALHKRLGKTMIYVTHDQVEATLMRRAGYECRVMPVETESYEDNPPTLLDFIKRDHRWCNATCSISALWA
ncbi:MAG: ATP-binding cassette domain-containing protein [Gammaproteobacteria bacterium]|nr:ATP-binding cassette domain-containing protein [Gammaproteobacteria bacterium]